eukprot:365847-Chlamydomonas_euryale.AAC.34
MQAQRGQQRGAWDGKQQQQLARRAHVAKVAEQLGLGALLMVLLMALLQRLLERMPLLRNRANE